MRIQRVTRMTSRLFVLLVFRLSIVASAESSARSLYLLEDDHGRWCGFRTERLWTAEKASAATSARVDYANGRVAFVYMSKPDESGDWTTYDKYTFDKNEILSSLERTMDIIAVGIKEEQLWTIKNGRAVEQKHTSRDLMTNKVVPDQNMLNPSPDIITSGKTFPFWPLVRDKWPEVISKGRVCLDQR